MDEGTRAIIQLAIERNTEENNKYLDNKFTNLNGKIDGIMNVVNEIKMYGCKLCSDHIIDHEKKEKKFFAVATIIPTIITIFGFSIEWFKNFIINASRHQPPGHP